MTSNTLFPRQESQKRNFGYKTRNMSHKLRPVKVPKDSKDVKYKPPGTDNERFKQSENQQSHPAPNQQNLDKHANGDATKKVKPAKQQKTIQRESHANSVTLSENQFTKILELISSARVNPSQPRFGTSEEELLEKYVTQINKEVEETRRKIDNLTEDPPASLQSISENNQLSSQNKENTTNQQTSLNQQPPTPPSNPEPVQKTTQNSASHRPFQFATQSAFQIGGDGAPDLSVQESIKQQKKQEWLDELKKQREEQQKRKEHEKQKIKEDRQVRMSWSKENNSDNLQKSSIKVGIDMNAGKDSIGELLSRPKSQEVSNVSEGNRTQQEVVQQVIETSEKVVEPNQNYPYFGGDEKKKTDKNEQWKNDLAKQITEREQVRKKIAKENEEANAREDARIKHRF